MKFTTEWNIEDCEYSADIKDNIATLTGENSTIVLQTKVFKEAIHRLVQYNKKDVYNNIVFEPSTERNMVRYYCAYDRKNGDVVVFSDRVITHIIKVFNSKSI